MRSSRIARSLTALLAYGLTACAGSSTPAPSAGAPTASAPEASPSSSIQVSPSVGPSTTFTPQAGGLIDIGNGRSLWLECSGTGSPTVLLESGLGGDHRTWELVQPRLAESGRVCTYDRAGIGESDPATTPRTAADTVEDLELLLEAADIEPPYVLVGFSIGGAIAQLYSATHPEDIAGLVLVESNHPDEVEQFEAHLTPAQVAEDRAEVMNNPEGFDPFTSLEQLQAAGPQPDVPLVVVTAGISEGWPPGWDAAMFDALRADQQADLVTLTSQGTQVIADNSRHHVPSEQPGVIVEAVATVLRTIAE